LLKAEFYANFGPVLRAGRKNLLLWLSWTAAKAG
jgi:hypothetical protein